MTAISADLILTCNNSFDILENSAIVYDEKIIAVDSIETIQKQYPDLTIEHKPDSILLPGLINAHVHLEFSAHRSELDYGSFIGWLFSVIQKREQLSGACDVACIESVLNELIRYGTTTIGAISSFGLDTESCAKSPIKAVFFNEAIGSNPAAIDTLFADFMQRLNHSIELASDTFFPTIAIHSPYSIHPIYTKKVLEIAREKQMVVSTHFLESPEEREWLEKSSGPFLEFFQGIFKTGSALITPKDFLAQFDGIPTLFTHVVHADEVELQMIKDMGGGILHCPKSNRLLSGQTLDMEQILARQIPLLPATDGLSSNNTLNLFDELRSALFIHQNVPLETCAKSLLHGSTLVAANMLGLPTGSLEKEKAADFLVCDLQSGMLESQTPVTDLLLHTQKPNEVHINGVRH